jgi:p-methyltransferase
LPPYGRQKEGADMSSENRLSCLVIGYNESPFLEYETRLRGYGDDSEAYRDLKFSMAQIGQEKMNFVGLMNRVYGMARGIAPGSEKETFLSGAIPNLAAVYLVNFLRRQGLSSDYINLFQNEKDKIRALADNPPYCVALTTTFYVLNFPVIEMVEFLRETLPETKIVVGGPLVSNHLRNYSGRQLEVALEDLGVDIFVIESQGEETLCSIARCLEEGGDLRKVPNIAYFDHGSLQYSDPVPEVNSLDANYINWHDFRNYDLGPTLQTRTARSCAFNCAFCNYPTRAGKLTLASIDTIEKELESMRSIGGVKNVVFIDDTFNVPLPRFKDFCRLLIRKKYDFNWFSYFRCSNADDEAFDLMAESGCKGVFLGIESGSPTILQNMSKHATVSKYEVGIERLHERGILSFGSFIVGFPGETAATVRETADFIRQTKPSYYRAQMWYNEPGTPIQARREEFDISGEGFVWEHRTMDSLGAMDLIDRLFLEIDESRWLPQWSFDFWFIPYMLGKGLTLDQFGEFMDGANQLLRLNVASVPEQQRIPVQQSTLSRLVELAKDWQVA